MVDNKKIILISGISGSGKSTYSHKLWLKDIDNTILVSRDKLRELLFGFNEENIYLYYEFPSEKLNKLENIISNHLFLLIKKGLEEGKTVIVDNTHLKTKYLKWYNQFKVPTELHLLKINKEEAIERDSKRKRQVGRSIIENQYNQFNSLLQTLNLKNSCPIHGEEVEIVDLDFKNK